jgi:uracil-DNA glycosylase family 4
VTKNLKTKTQLSRQQPAVVAAAISVGTSTDPGRNCPLCPRLAAYRQELRVRDPDGFNAPVPSFGAADAGLLILGLAPGAQGANRTGRPFTGDFAGDLLYTTLIEFGFATGTFEARPDDSLTLTNSRITNAVRCVPPQNKPLPVEITTCRPFLIATMDTMPKLRAVVLLGRVAHDTMLKTLGIRAVLAPFSHGAVHDAGRLKLYDSYHCSRYNTNTRVLTPEMFRSVFARVKDDLAKVES